MDNIYKQIETIIKGVSTDIWQDVDEGQFEVKPTDKIPVSYPAALRKVDDDIQYTAIAGGKQIARTSFTVRLAYKQLESTHSKVPEPFTNKGFEPYAHAKEVMIALEKGMNKNMQSCTRTNFKRESLTHPTIFRLTYRLNYLDTDI